jgi:hypothetical protein
MLRADDDVWINIDRIFVTLDSMPQEKLLWGDIFYNAPVKRDGKWGHTKEEWFLDFYPPYTNVRSLDEIGNIFRLREQASAHIFFSNPPGPGISADVRCRVLAGRNVGTEFPAFVPFC